MEYIIGSFIGSCIIYSVMELYIHFIVQPKYSEYGRMSKLIWSYDWHFCLMDYGVTKVFKEGEMTTHSFSGDWMYKLLMKDRPEQQKCY